jgi:hypothetical protein
LRCPRIPKIRFNLQNVGEDQIQRPAASFDTVTVCSKIARLEAFFLVEFLSLLGSPVKSGPALTMVVNGLRFWLLLWNLSFTPMQGIKVGDFSFVTQQFIVVFKIIDTLSPGRSFHFTNSQIPISLSVHNHHPISWA